MDARVVFMGSPDFALPVLESLVEHYPIVGVVTQPDRPAGRGRVLTPPPVKQLALERQIPVIQPRRLRDPEAMETLQTWNPDVIVVTAFGQILRLEVLSLPPFGCVNVHASLLPRWRGAAPIQAAILNGDEKTGITIMLMDPGVDTGPILNQREIPIAPDETAGSLGERLARLGAELLLDTLPAYLSGVIQPKVQDETLASYAPMLKKADGLLDFTQPAEHLSRKVRAFNPWPGAYTIFQGEVLKIHRAHAVNPVDQSNRSAPVAGRYTHYSGMPAITTSHGLLVLDELQPAGKKSMPGRAFLQGARGWGESSGTS
jgi:methionyl-tRNA formyltransferase